MKAERERREAILRAEGEKKSHDPGGGRPEGVRRSWTRRRRSRPPSCGRRPRRRPPSSEAEGQAEAILKVQQANADGLRFLKEAAADDAVIQLKSLEAFAKAADGKATKIIIPSEIQSLAGMVKSLTEVGTDE